MDYKEGSTIEYKAANGDLRTVNVTQRYDNIPHWNKPGFDGVNVADERVLFWGFDDTIVRVIKV